jgi:hypothetical protein
MAFPNKEKPNPNKETAFPSKEMPNPMSLAAIPLRHIAFEGMLLLRTFEVLVSWMAISS